jgi:hypothetical protein
MGIHLPPGVASCVTVAVIMALTRLMKRCAYVETAEYRGQELELRTRISPNHSMGTNK